MYFRKTTSLHCVCDRDVTCVCFAQEMFDLLVSLGAELHVKNKQGLTPLTLAASLAKKEVRTPSCCQLPAAASSQLFVGSFLMACNVQAQLVFLISSLN